IRCQPLLVPFFTRDQLLADGEIFGLRNRRRRISNAIKKRIAVGIGNLGSQLEKNNVSDHDGYSSSSFNFAKTEKSSSVVVSPMVPCPEARSRSKRRMIFPLRVFGSESVNRISSGLAKLPM